MLQVMAVLQENKIGQLSPGPEMEAFRDMLKSVLKSNLDRFRPHFQFGWTGSPDLANSVAMQVILHSAGFTFMHAFFCPKGK